MWNLTYVISSRIQFTSPVCNEPIKRVSVIAGQQLSMADQREPFTGTACTPPHILNGLETSNFRPLFLLLFPNCTSQMANIAWQHTSKGKKKSTSGVCKYDCTIPAFRKMPHACQPPTAPSGDPQRKSSTPDRNMFIPSVAGVKRITNNLRQRTQALCLNIALFIQRHVLEVLFPEEHPVT